MEKIKFEITTEYIHMIQLLKAANVIESGGIAKMVVEDGLVTYNGVVDYRKRLKVKKGDIVTFDGIEIEVI